MSRRKLPGAALAAAGLVMAITALVLIVMNRGPDFPAMSYTPPPRVLATPASDDAGGSGGITTGGTAPGAQVGASAGSVPLLSEITGSMSQAQKLAAIDQRYQPYFRAQQAAYQQELKRMLSCAKSDYLALRGRGDESTLSRLAMEYLEAGRQLERQSDSEFEALVGQMEGELKSHGLPQDLGTLAREQYRQQKSTYREKIMQLMERQKL